MIKINWITVMNFMTSRRDVTGMMMNVYGNHSQMAIC